MQVKIRQERERALGYGRPFGWRPFIIALLASGAATGVSALILDEILIAYGVSLTRYWDAFYSGFFGLGFAGPGILIVWRLGVVTLQQYLLCSFILMSPLTILSLVFVSITQDVVLQAPWDPAMTISAHDLAYTGYVRIARSAILVPIFLIAFTLVYHRHYGCSPRK